MWNGDDDPENAESLEMDHEEDLGKKELIEGILNSVSGLPRSSF